MKNLLLLLLCLLLAPRFLAAQSAADDIAAGDAALRNGNLAGAHAAYGNALAEDPHNPDANLMRALTVWGRYYEDPPASVEDAFSAWGIEWTKNLYAIHRRKVLLVEDRTFCRCSSVLDDNFYRFEYWYVEYEGLPTASKLREFDVVLWNFPGRLAGSLTPEKEELLSAYLDGGGRLLVMGPGVLEPASADFRLNYLKVDSYQELPESRPLIGVTGDPITAGMTQRLNFFTGQPDTSLVAIDPAAGASVILTDDSGNGRALRYENAEYGSRLILLPVDYNLLLRRRGAVRERYQVWGTNTSSPALYPYPGYTFLGQATTASDFAAPFDYYLIAVKRGESIRVDAVEGIRDGISYTPQTWMNVLDANAVSSAPSEPDGQFAVLGAIEYEGYLFVDARADNLSGIRVHVASGDSWPWGDPNNGDSLLEKSLAWLGVPKDVTLPTAIPAHPPSVNATVDSVFGGGIAVAEEMLAHLEKVEDAGDGWRRIVTKDMLPPFFSELEAPAFGQVGGEPIFIFAEQPNAGKPENSIGIRAGFATFGDGDGSIVEESGNRYARLTSLADFYYNRAEAFLPEGNPSSSGGPFASLGNVQLIGADISVDIRIVEPPTFALSGFVWFTFEVAVGGKDPRYFFSDYFPLPTGEAEWQTITLRNLQVEDLYSGLFPGVEGRSFSGRASRLSIGVFTSPTPGSTTTVLTVEIDNVRVVARNGLEILEEFEDLPLQDALRIEDPSVFDYYTINHTDVLVAETALHLANFVRQFLRGYDLNVHYDDLLADNFRLTQSYWDAAGNTDFFTNRSQASFDSARTSLAKALEKGLAAVDALLPTPASGQDGSALGGFVSSRNFDAEDLREAKPILELLLSSVSRDTSIRVEKDIDPILINLGNLFNSPITRANLAAFRFDDGDSDPNDGDNEFDFDAWDNPTVNGLFPALTTKAEFFAEVSKVEGIPILVYRDPEEEGVIHVVWGSEYFGYPGYWDGQQYRDQWFFEPPNYDFADRIDQFRILRRVGEAANETVRAIYPRDRFDESDLWQYEERNVSDPATLTFRVEIVFIDDDGTTAARSTRPFRLDDDTLPDWWELGYFSDLGYFEDDDPDLDGVTNWQEFQFTYTSPNESRDADADSLPDDWERFRFGFFDNQDADDDPDGDRIPNRQEFRYGLNPSSADVVALAEAGWNLMSIPKFIAQRTMAEVFQGLHIGSIWTWDGTRFIPLQQSDLLSYKKGYWGYFPDNTVLPLTP